MELQNVKDDLRKVVLAFNVKVSEDVKNIAKDFKIGVFESDIIYRIIDEYKEWSYKKKERELEEKLAKVARPCQIKILKGFVFRASKPAIFGVEVKKGVLKPGVLMMKEGGKIIGRVKEVQKEGEHVPEVKAGDRAAVSMEDPTIGRQINEEDLLIAVISEHDKKILKEVFDKLSESEKEMLEE